MAFFRAKNLRLLLLLNFLVVIPCKASEPNHTISGLITNIKDAPIIIYLVDEETSKIPLDGVYTIVIHPNKVAIEQNYIEFAFHNIPAGVYGIRCYQDVNNNNELDKGLMGPVEPWGLSWNSDAMFSIPSFDNFNFTLSSSDVYITITLQ